jgi:DNA polymerase-3 subunit alpha (Gram-positive type)
MEKPFAINSINIKKINYSKKTKQLNVFLSEPCDNQKAKALKTHLKKELGFLNEIKLVCNPKPKNHIDSLKEFTRNYKKSFPYLNGIISKMELKDTTEESSKLCIYLKVDNDINRSRIKQVLKQKYSGIIPDVSFINDEDENVFLTETEKEIEIKEAISDFSSVGNAKNSGGRPNYKLKGKVVSISDALLKEESSVLVEGTLIFKDRKVLKSGKNLEIVHLTDHKNTLAAKQFLETRDRGFGTIEVGESVRIKGYMRYDKFERENILFTNAFERIPKTDNRKDTEPIKRIELHCHTNMSSMDGVSSTESLFKKASEMGHKALAITDHGIVQAFPDAYKYSEKYKVKAIYGMEGYLVDDDIKIIIANQDTRSGISIEDTFVVFDIETTGLSFSNDRITEIGAVKIKNGSIVDSINLLINPQKPIPQNIQELTGITDETVKNSPTFREIASKLKVFFGNYPIVAHNALFDYTFIRNEMEACESLIDNTVIDTLEMAKMIFPEYKRHNLKTLCKRLKINLKNHHRASDDAMATAELFKIMLEKYDGNSLDLINEEARRKIDFKKSNTYHVTLYAKNKKGLRNLYELVTMSHIDYFYKKPRIIKSELSKKREGLLIGSACESGELFRAILEQKKDDELDKIISFYDFTEVQPLENNRFLIENKIVSGLEDLIAINKKIIQKSNDNDKIVVATGDVHFVEPENAINREILMSGQGFSDSGNQPPLYLKTTDEMLDDFSYLGQDKAKELVIENPAKINNLIKNILPIPLETFPPEISGSEEALRKMCYEKAMRLYGNPLPQILEKRLERELQSIIGNGYSVMYIIAQKLVAKSLNDGYLVGSRGSVGSSLAATMSDITEVNPLPPHYLCAKCKFCEFLDGDDYGSGIDLPPKKCPVCGTLMQKDGQDIPFEVFLGFDGDKEPDIDLNFAGEYQAVAHKYTEELFGKGKVFKAGTIGTIATKTAYGFVKKYMEQNERQVSKYEINRLLEGCTGVKRTTGQHPGGIMVVPHYKDIHEFTPIQKPANDSDTDVITTHFDYHAISGRLLKLDILGHDAPSTLKFLQELTGLDPVGIPLDDPKTMSLFTSVDALNLVENKDYFDMGSVGIPEFGTKFVRQMLADTKPTTFSELVRISGLSHGTDVWVNNAQDLVKAGVAELKNVISTRDDIMNYLIQKGLPNKNAFKIMENVRKGRGLSEEDIVLMKESNVPGWYIDSCNKIKYMFPKAHAAAYVMMSFRIAYFKVHHPLAFYATYFTNKVVDFDAELICMGQSHIRKRMKELGSNSNDLKQKEKDQLTVLEVAYEMYSRGYSFSKIDIYKSEPKRFSIVGESLLCPLLSLQGLGETAADSLAKEREKTPFLSLEDMRTRTKLSKKIIEKLRENRCMEVLPETNQLQMFDLQ